MSRRSQSQLIESWCPWAGESSVYGSQGLPGLRSRRAPGPWIRKVLSVLFTRWPWLDGQASGKPPFHPSTHSCSLHSHYALKFLFPLSAPHSQRHSALAIRNHTSHSHTVFPPSTGSPHLHSPAALAIRRCSRQLEIARRNSHSASAFHIRIPHLLSPLGNRIPR